MKKILLIILTIILILSVNVLAVDIDIGMPAIDRASSTGTNTYVDKLNPANGTGKITSVEIWAAADLINCEVATFFQPDPGGFPNNFTTRDTQVIGTVTAGSKQTFPVDLDVEEGDYIGIYFTAGTLERDLGSGGYWYHNVDDIPCVNQEFWVTGSGAELSLYGTGTTVVVGWDHKWNTQEISKWNNQEIIKWNGLE